MLKQTFQGLFWKKIGSVPLKRNLKKKKKIQYLKPFFTPILYPKNPKVFENSLFGDYNIYFVRQN